MADGAPNDNGILQEDLTDPDYPKNTREAILYVYPAEKGNGLSVVACPGGGYSILPCTTREQTWPPGSTVRA